MLDHTNDVTPRVFGIAALSLLTWGCGDLLAQPVDSSIPADTEFSDGVSPTHVYAKLELVERSLDALLGDQRLLDSKFPAQIETDLQPMHVYQTLLLCLRRVQEYDEKVGVLTLPTITARPRKYEPRDVYFLVLLMHDNLKRAARKLGVELPEKELESVPAKEPLDVFNLGVRVFVKLHAMCGLGDVLPSEVYAEMVRAGEDARSILKQQDPACRYSIQPKPGLPDRKPSDVFEECLVIRRSLNALRSAFGLGVVRVPKMPDRDSINPRDVFLQTQIIIAELNLLKVGLETHSSTPLPIPVDNMTPTDVHQKALLVNHLVRQIKTPAVTAAQDTR